MAKDGEGRSVAVSVVIPSFNEEQYIRSCLHSIFNQRTTRSYEVIVVDSSNDATPKIIAREFPGAELVMCRHHQTPPAEARNIGIRRARAPIVAFIDADCAADPDWIEAIVSAHQEGYLAVGGSIRLAKPFTLVGGILFAIEFSEFLPTSQSREGRWLPSGNLSVKRESLERYGGFPTHTEACEDILFSRNLMARSGSPLWFEPRMKVTHPNCDTSGEVRRKLRTLGYWSAQARRSGPIPGRILLEHPMLIPLLVPYRFCAILLRLWRGSGHRTLCVLVLLCAPLLLYWLSCWARAFWRGAAEARRSVREVCG